MQNFLTYLQQEASTNNFTLPPDLPTEITGFQISNPSATVSGITLTVKGDVSVDTSTGLPSLGFGGMGIPTSIILDLMSKLSSASVQVTASVTAGESPSVKLSFPVGTVTIPMGMSNNPQFTDVGLFVIATQGDPNWSFTLGIDGTLPIKNFDGTPVSVQASVSFTISDGKITGAQGAITEKFNPPFKVPLELSGGLSIDISQATESLGFSFGDKPQVLLGLEGTGTVTPQGSSPIDIKKLAVVWNLEDDDPIPWYFGFNIGSSITLSEFIGIVDGGISVANVPDITFTDPAFAYCGPQAVTLPDGTPASPGFSVSSGIKIGSLELYGACTYNPNNEIKASFQSNGPISFGASAFYLGGNASAINRKTGVDNYKVPTTTAEWTSRNNATSTEVSNSGGPEFSLNLSKTSDPNLSADGKLGLFGSPVAAIDAKTGPNGGLSVTASIAGITSPTFHLHSMSSITSDFGFGSTSTIPILPPGEQGSGFGGMGSYVKGTSFGATLNMSGENLTGTITKELFGKIKTVVPNTALQWPQSLSGLIAELMQSLTSGSSIRTMMEMLTPFDFQTLFNNGFIDFGNTNPANIIVNGLVNLGESYTTMPGLLATDAPEYAAQELSSALSSIIGMDLKTSTGIVYNVSTLIEDKIGYSLTSITKGASQFFYGTDKEIATFFNSVLPGASNIEAVANALVDGIEGETAHMAGIALQAAGYAENEILSIFKDMGGAFESAAHWAEKNLDPANW